MKAMLAEGTSSGEFSGAFIPAMRSCSRFMRVQPPVQPASSISGLASQSDA